ncbi:MAG TPA: M23 family metallopeptidase [Vicinamibacterales bacterium]|nr:M23 family metallopeptidase [Vicinamibacterales bacterium]
MKRNARLVALGALWGFLAGALSVALVVWKADRSETWLGAGARFLADRQDAVDRWDRGPVDDDAPVLEARVGTAGSEDGPNPTPSISAPPEADLDDRDLALPVEGLTKDRLVRSFGDARGARKHEAIDILAPMGTPVKAVEDGRIARLFNSKAGGITIYQFDPSERYCYYYAHLQRYADGLRENDRVRKGQVIGYVGVTGNAPKDTPHLHFAIFRLTGEKRWWEGTPVDPYDILR